MKYIVILCCLCFGYNCYALKPSHEVVMIPDLLNVPYKEQNILSSNGSLLFSLTLFPAGVKDKKTHIVLAYSDFGNLSFWLENASQFALAGYTVTLFDYRGFGSSTAFDIDTNYLYYNEFTDDLAVVIKWVKVNYPNQKIGIWGLATGTILASIVMQSEKIDFFIADGFIADPKSIKKLFPHTILPPESKKTKKTKKMPKTLFFSGNADDIMSLAGLEDYVKNNNPNAKIVTYDGGRLQGFEVLTEQNRGDIYVSIVDKFLEIK